MSNRMTVVLCMCIGAIVAFGVLFVAPLLREAEPKPTCLCKAESCPVPATCPVSTPAPACPAQPTLEIHKPLSAELDAVVARCKPVVEHDLVAVADATKAAEAAMLDARKTGVSALVFGWLEDTDARAAATALLGAEWTLDKAMDVAFEADTDCRHDIEDAVHATAAWTWLEDVESTFEPSRVFMDKFYEFFGTEFVGDASCNMVARRLECPQVPNGRHTP